VFMANQEKLGVRSEGVRGMHEACMSLQDMFLAGQRQEMACLAHSCVSGTCLCSDACHSC
jgi:hypothetical protein